MYGTTLAQMFSEILLYIESMTRRVECIRSDIECLADDGASS